VLYLGVRESYTTYAQWRYGYGASDAQIEQYAADRLAWLVVPPLLIFAVAVGSLVLVVLLRHRKRVGEARGVVAAAGFANLALGGLAVVLPLMVIGVLVILAALVLGRPRESSAVG
jgi:hypothetical protein